MTLPFRRRHHDAEAGHDRARMLMSEGLLAHLPQDEAAWLERHVDGCAECARELSAFRADQELLRGLREQPIEPPRDLWARTSAALDREGGRRRGPAPAARPATRGGWRALPLGAAASVAVVAVMIGLLMPRTSIPPAASAPGGTNVAVIPTPASTGIVLPESEPLVVFRETANGKWELVYSEVKEVCNRDRPRCAPKPDEDAQSIDLGNKPSKITMSPNKDKLVIAEDADPGDQGQILVVPVDEPGASPTPTVIVTLPPETPPAGSESAGPPTASPAPTPEGAIAIASGVRLVGDVAYSADGRWLAFSAEPSDGSTGPDLYLWDVGEPIATAVTSDHRTYFSSWHDGMVLASRIEIAGAPAAPDESAEPGDSEEPGTGGVRGNGQGNGGGGNGQGNGGQGGGRPNRTEPPAPTESTTTVGPDGSSSPDASPAAPIEGRPVSFLLDPASLDVTTLARTDVWLPVLDPTGGTVVYWSGTLLSDDGRTWALGTGDLVLDRWSDEVSLPIAAPEASDEAGGTDDPDAPSEATEPPATTAPGPVGEPTILVPGDKATFQASFGPAGDHLAVWVGEDLGDEVGRLHLLVVDPETGEVSADFPLQGERALRRFSIDTGRLAWVTPPGQDGAQSTVQVLGWKGDEFGEIEPQSGTDLYIAP